MITYDDVLKKASEGSDIQAHLVRLYNLTVEFPVKEKVIVELGVSGGFSTTALLAAVNDSGGHLYSVDILDFSNVFKGEPNWTFILGDDMEVVKGWNKPIDHLFIDTLHTFDQTLMELREWGNWVKQEGIITLHDLYYPCGERREVWDAIERHIEENIGIYDFVMFEGSHGLGLLRRE